MTVLEVQAKAVTFGESPLSETSWVVSLSPRRPVTHSMSSAAKGKGKKRAAEELAPVGTLLARLPRNEL